MGGNGGVRTIFRTGSTSDNIVNQGIGFIYRSHSSSLTPRTVPSTMNPVFPLRTGCQLITLEPQCGCPTCSTTCLAYSSARRTEPTSLVCVATYLLALRGRSSPPRLSSRAFRDLGARSIVLPCHDERLLAGLILGGLEVDGGYVELNALDGKDGL